MHFNNCLNSYEINFSGSIFSFSRKIILATLIFVGITSIPGQNSAKSNKSGFPAMILIPGGEFEYYEKVIDQPCKPLKNKTLIDSFYVSEALITGEQYAKFAKANQKRLYQAGNCYLSNVAIRGLAWVEAAEYCNWLSQKDSLVPYYFIDYEKEMSTGVVTVKQNEKSAGYRLINYSEYEFISRLDNQVGLDITDEKAHQKPPCKYYVKMKKPNAFGIYDLKDLTLEFSNNLVLYKGKYDDVAYLSYLKLGTKLSQISHGSVEMSSIGDPQGDGFRVVRIKRSK